MRDRRRADALMAMRRLVTIDPGPDYLFIAASGAMDMNRPVEAIQLLQRADLDSVNFLSKWGLANTRLGQAYHLVGEHEAELTIAEQNLPENLNLQMVLNVIYALGALGRVEELNEVIELGMTLQPTPWRGGMFLYAADELRAHGHESDAAEFNARALAWLERRSSDGPLNPFNESYQFVTALMSAGRLEEAKEILEGLLEDSPANTVPLVHLAVIAARLGDRSEALRISRLEAVATSPYGPSQIAAELGELERAVELLRDGFSNGASGAMVLGRLHKEDYHRRLWDYPPFQELMRPKG